MLGLGIQPERIFCSSIEGQGVKSGQYIPDRLREEMNSSCLALLFVSSNFKSSEICLNEVGAAWVKLPKENVIPLMLPNADFHLLGFLDLNRLGIKIYKREDVLQLIDDCREQLKPSNGLQKISSSVDTFIIDIAKYEVSNDEDGIIELLDEEVDEFQNCFNVNLFPLDEIIRKAIPAKPDGIHKIEDVRVQNQLLEDVGKAAFLKTFWYMFSGGDSYVEFLQRLPNGNWIISSSGWEVKIGEMWVCRDRELQYEFILLKSEKLGPFSIQSDVGGSGYYVGVLSDGTVVSENEIHSGYAVIGGNTVRLDEVGVKDRYRDSESRWVFMTSRYHKAGYNSKETIAFCRELDKGVFNVNDSVIFEFLRSLNNHPIVMMNR